MTAETPRTWRSYDARGARSGPLHSRVDDRDGTKIVWWRTAAGVGLGSHRMPDLLYLPGGVPLPPSVVICEGEKAADAVRAAGLEAAGTVCGAGATVVWSEHAVELFRDVEVTLWPDFDRVGREHMGRVATLLEPFVVGMRLVDVPSGMPSGWDAADAPSELVVDLVARAHRVWLKR